MAGNKYNDFFEIDKNYFPVVDQELIESGQVDWRDFYPHQSFIRLLQGSLDAIENIKPKAMWVEGAYGTGKSYAVLTIKELLTQPESEIESYFKDNLEQQHDLLARLLNIREKKILVAQRYGSSDIDSDKDLINAVQTAIGKALEDNGYEIRNDTVKKTIIKWLEDSSNSNYFNDILGKDNNTARIGYSSSEQIVSVLNSTDEKISSKLVSDVIELCNERSIKIANVTTIDDLTKWIKEVIESNELDCLLFIWDEFTEYFKNNKNSLTGFQKLAESCASSNFKLMIVTHSSESLLVDDDRDKILDRFVRPTYKIELPERKALDLIARAMKKKDDEELKIRWKKYCDSFAGSLTDSRIAVTKQTGISEDTLNRIIPITPYAALLLMHLSSTFRSNQRSMFEFIKDKADDETKGFQWFIANTGQSSTWNLLTIDMLWTYFYENGKDGLETDVRLILDSYDINKSKMGSGIEYEKIFKAIILLQAMSNKVGNSVPIFKPTLANLRLAFDGTELVYRVQQIADSLVKKQLLISMPNEKNELEYNVGTNSSDYMKIEGKIQEDLKTITTTSICNETEYIKEKFEMEGYYTRLKPVITDKDHLKTTLSMCKSHDSTYNNVDVIIVLAISEGESIAAKNAIEAIKIEQNSNLIIIDATKTYLGIENTEKFIRSRAWESYYLNKDTKKSKSYSEEKTNVIKDWMDRLQQGKFVIYGPFGDTEECRNYEHLKSIMLSTVNKLYPLGLENFKVMQTKYYITSQNAREAVKCAINRDNKGRFLAPPKDQLKTSLKEVWDVENYWTNPEISDATISKLKIAVEENIKKQLASNKSISVKEIVELLHKKPYGFINSDLSAYYTGFLLTEYAKTNYSISNGKISPENPVNAIAEAIYAIYTKNGRDDDWFITPISDKLAIFYSASSAIFKFEFTSNLDDCVDRIRASIRNFGFPLWSIPSGTNLSEDVLSAINLFDDIVSTNNASEKNNLAEKIGNLCMSEEFIESLKDIFTKENCWIGMKKYIKQYRDGEVITLSHSFTNEDPLKFLANKQTVDSAWLWDQKTTDNSIEELIKEFKIISKFHEVGSTECKDLDSTRTLIKKWMRELNLPIKLVENIYPQYSSLLNNLLRFSQIIPDANLITKLESELDLLEDVLHLTNNLPYLFQKTYPNELSDYNKSQIIDIVKLIEVIDSNAINIDQYKDAFKKAIDKYNKNQKKNNLFILWEEKTGTANSKKWSIKKLTPIRAILGSSEEVELLINVLSGYITDPDLIEKVEKYLRNSNVFELLADQKRIDESFREKVLGRYSVLFEDLDEIRNRLLKQEPDVDKWMTSGSIIKKLAYEEYEEHGKEKAMKTINTIPKSELEGYIRNLIENDSEFGIELLKKHL
jgi:hypothetical protein